jgi:hypothetical protein
VPSGGKPRTSILTGADARVLLQAMEGRRAPVRAAA